MAGVAYNPYDPNQARLLGAISLSEVGRHPDPLNLGNGFVDLSDAPKNQYGFPVWRGQPTPDGRGSRAAGYFQFQPGTWESYAKQYDLDFQDASDQKAAAWYLAQDTFRKETGRDLSAALQSGDYATIESALGRTQWIGARGKLAEFLGGGQSRPVGEGTPPISDDTSGRGWNPFTDGIAELPGAIGREVVKGALSGGTFARILLFIVGGLILVAAVWWLLSDVGVVPGPGSVAKIAAGAAKVAA